MNFRYILADTETTGPTPQDRVCEVAWLELDGELQVLDRQYSLIDPGMPISASASGVHGITNANVADAPTLPEFFDIILGGRYFAADDAVLLIAHNSAFDKRYLAAHVPIRAELCTLRLARRTWPEMENHKLATLMYALDLKRGQSHSAAGDVDTCYDLLAKIVQKLGKPLPELAKESMAPQWVETMPFGKHKGSKLRDLPQSYINWLLGLDNLDLDMRYSLNLVMRGEAP